MKTLKALLLSFLISISIYSQFIQPVTKLTATGGDVMDMTGASTSVSADGKTIVTGAWGSSLGKGAAYVFYYSGSAWNNLKLTGTGGTLSGNAFGQSVAISGDGNTIIIGAPQEGNPVKGAAWIFTRNGNLWNQQAILRPSDATNNAMVGYSVSLSDDGNTAVVGSFGDLSGAGAFWVFYRVNNAWVQQGSKIIAAGNVGDAWQGCSVDISGDGNTIIEGGYKDNNNIGAAWIFTRFGNGWLQQAKLCADDAVGAAGIGACVAISHDGNTAVVGGLNDNNQYGAAWVFTRTNDTWTQQCNKLVASALSSNAKFGSSVDISADGNTILIGNSNDNNTNGSVSLFARSGSKWNVISNRFLTNAAGAYFGSSVALNSDGYSLAIGGPMYNNIGAVWMLNRYADIYSSAASISPSTTTAGLENTSCTITFSLSGGQMVNGELYIYTPQDWIVGAVSSSIGNASLIYQGSQYGAVVKVSSLSVSKGQPVYINLTKVVQGHTTGNIVFPVKFKAAATENLSELVNEPSVYVQPIMVSTGEYFITSPKKDDKWQSGTYKYIEWKRTGGIVYGTMLLEYSTDNGNTWTAINKTPIAGIMRYSWLVPNVNSSVCKIRMSNFTSHKVYDINDEPFAIYTQNSLFGNYPNPFNPSTIINYNIPAEGHVEISVFNVLGQKVRELVNEFKRAGSYTVKFEASDLSSGVYFYTLRMRGFVETKKLIIQK